MLLASKDEKVSWDGLKCFSVGFNHSEIWSFEFQIWKLLCPSSILLQIYQLARDTVVLLLECNPDMGQLLEWVIDRCYTSEPREADACFLALAAIFSAR